MPVRRLLHSFYFFSRPTCFGRIRFRARHSYRCWSGSVRLLFCPSRGKVRSTIPTPALRPQRSVCTRESSFFSGVSVETYTFGIVERIRQPGHKVIPILVLHVVHCCPTCQHDCVAWCWRHQPQCLPTTPRDGHGDCSLKPPTTPGGGHPCVGFCYAAVLSSRKVVPRSFCYTFWLLFSPPVHSTLFLAPQVMTSFQGNRLFSHPLPSAI